MSKMFKDFFFKVSTADARNVIAIIFILGILGVIYILLFKPVPAENKDLINVLGGTAIGGGLGTVLGYYFGASKKESDSGTTTIEGKETK